jgi:hypothetical protein
MIEERWKPVLPHLLEFQKHLAELVPPLELIAANDHQWTQERYLEQCRTGIFNKYGVYLIFAPDESLEYVGLAMNRFHDRIWSHDDWVNRRWTDVIPLRHEHYFLGPALEFLLICRLRPPKNKVYKSYTIPFPPEAAELSGPEEGGVLLELPTLQAAGDAGGEDAPAVAKEGLPDWTAVYDGMTDEEVQALEAIILSRRSFTKTE